MDDIVKGCNIKISPIIHINEKRNKIVEIDLFYQSSKLTIHVTIRSICISQLILSRGTNLT